MPYVCCEGETRHKADCAVPLLFPRLAHDVEPRPLTSLERAAVVFVEVYDRFGPHVATYGRGPKLQVENAYAGLRAEVEKAKT